jgi:fumarate reductase flavoprotein subunit
LSIPSSLVWQAGVGRLTVKPAPAEGFATTVPVAVIGAGAAGLCAALAAHETGTEVAVFERDPLPRGSTALSAGLVPAAATQFQRVLGVTDSAELFAADIRRKAHDEGNSAIAELVARESGPTIEWLTARYDFPFSLVHDFNYPGHSAYRMHGLPSRSGAELIDRLHRAAERAEITVVCDATISGLFADDQGVIRGLEVTRPDGSSDRMGCDALILACNGYGGAPDLVAKYIPEMRTATYFGHPGNRGDAVLWGQALGAKLENMSGYQGHGSVAHPHAILISWAVVMEGGFQVNVSGQRFSDESLGYSEQAAVVLAQPGGAAFDIFDERIAAIARQFEDFRQAEAAGAVVEAASIEDLAERLKLSQRLLSETFRQVESAKDGTAVDPFGRAFAGVTHLLPPYKAVRVTGALFHTQGGLAVNVDARVLNEDGAPLPNLFAAGGAAAGVSGSVASGYLSGNGLLTATVLGRISGASAAALVKSREL